MCAVEGNQAKCWGSNTDGKLGVNSGSAVLASPVSAESDSGINFPSSISDMSGGDGFGCTIHTQSNDYACAGSHEFGQLGINGPYGPGSFRQAFDSRQSFNGLGHDPDDVLVAVTSGATHSCLLTSWSRVYCWGENNAGELGNGSTNYFVHSQPTSGQVIFGTSDFDILQVSAGRQYTCALRFSGNVTCWGSNLFGTLGDSSWASTGSPADANNVPLSAPATQIYTYATHACALLNTGERWDLSTP